MTKETSLADQYEDPIISQVDFDDKDILEVGCGTGGFTLQHLTGASSILGIDRDSEAIDYLKTQRAKFPTNSRIDFLAGDIVDFPLPKEAFDVAVFSHSF
jgi:ubiquinone/menaquinone biosynthesis C-methylase UbiE